MSKALVYELGQSISFGRLTLRAKVLWPMLLAASDDQGRGLAQADAVKWKVCPNVPEITIDDIPDLLSEMVEQEMIYLYTDSRDRLLYQLVRWWEFQQLSWAQPSRFEAPEGWTDRIRYQKKGEGQVKNNWECAGGFNGDAPMLADADDELDTEDEQGSGYVAATSEQGSQQGSRQYNLTQYKSNQHKSRQLKKDDLGGDTPPSPSAEYQEIRQAWIDLFPDKPQPRANNQTLQGKVRTRMKSAHFRENWQAALTRAAKSTFLHEGSWFDLAWFLKNDDHYERCLQGKYDDGGNSSRASPDRAQSGPYKELEPWA